MADSGLPIGGELPLICQLPCASWDLIKNLGFPPINKNYNLNQQQLPTWNWPENQLNGEFQAESGVQNQVELGNGENGPEPVTKLKGVRLPAQQTMNRSLQQKKGKGLL